jgi:Putative auto-transporter adhesin, head GIN domain
MRHALIALPLLALAACGAANSESRDRGPDGTRSFAVGAFDAVSLEGSDDVHIVRGAAMSVVANGTPAVLDKLDIRVEGSTLKVGRKRSNWSMSWQSDRGATITVTVPAITAAAVAGSGDMSVDTVNGDAFTAAVAGSGALRLASVAVKRAKLSVAGSGDLMAIGTADDSSLSTAGSGDIDAIRLASRRITASAVGSGNIQASASESATISIAGSGDVAVRGTEKCVISKIGSGDASCSR